MPWVLHPLQGSGSAARARDSESLCWLQAGPARQGSPRHQPEACLGPPMIPIRKYTSNYF